MPLREFSLWEPVPKPARVRVPRDSLQFFRNRLRRQHKVDDTGGDCGGRHAAIAGRLLILRKRDSSFGPDHPQAYRAVNVKDKAWEHFSVAADKDRRNSAAHDGMARVLRDSGAPQLALADAYRAVHFAPWSPEARNTLGTILQDLGFHAAARAAYEGALSLNPRAAYALSNLCSLDLLAGLLEAAEARCTEAQRVDHNLVTASRNLERIRAMLAETLAEPPHARK